MQHMEYTWFMLWVRTLSSEERVGIDGEAPACLRKISHFSFRISRSSLNLSRSNFFFWLWEKDQTSVQIRMRFVNFLLLTLFNKIHYKPHIVAFIRIIISLITYFGIPFSNANLNITNKHRHSDVSVTTCIHLYIQ